MRQLKKFNITFINNQQAQHVEVAMKDGSIWMTGPFIITEEDGKLLLLNSNIIEELVEAD